MPIVTVAACSACFQTDLGWMALAASAGDPDACAVGGKPKDTWAPGVASRAAAWRLERLVFGHGKAAEARGALAADRPTSATDEAQDCPAEVQGWIELLQRYAAGEPASLDAIPVDRDHLTEFGQRVSRLCGKIGYGVTVSYGELARRAARPAAARAVGGVMSSNRTPLVVPCHRVLGAGGRLGGFSAPQGVAMKRRLLEMEGAWLF